MLRCFNCCVLLLLFLFLWGHVAKAQDYGSYPVNKSRVKICTYGTVSTKAGYGWTDIYGLRIKLNNNSFQDLNLRTGSTCAESPGYRRKHHRNDFKATNYVFLEKEDLNNIIIEWIPGGEGWQIVGVHSDIISTASYYKGSGSSQNRRINCNLITDIPPTIKSVTHKSRIDEFITISLNNFTSSGTKMLQIGIKHEGDFVWYDTNNIINSNLIKEFRFKIEEIPSFSGDWIGKEVNFRIKTTYTQDYVTISPNAFVNCPKYYGFPVLLTKGNPISCVNQNIPISIMVQYQDLLNSPTYLTDELNFPIEIRLKDSKDSFRQIFQKTVNSKDWTDFDEIDLDIPRSWYGKELQIRARKTVKNGVVIYSDPISGVFFLDAPSIQLLEKKEPSCASFDDASLILGFNELPKGKNLSYLLSISRYTKKSTGQNSILFPANGEEYWFADGFTTDGNIMIDDKTTSLTIDKEFLEKVDDEIRGNFSLQEGLFRFEIRTQTSSLESLCKSTFYFLVEPPSPLFLSIFPVPIEEGCEFHTKIKGDYGRVIMQARGGKPDVCYKYRIGESDLYHSFSGNKIEIDVKNGDAVYLTNENQCPEVEKIVLFNEPEPLKLSILSYTSPTCHQENRSEGHLKNNGSIVFSSSGGCEPVSFSLEALNDGDWVNTDLIPENNTFSKLSQGIYRIIAKDRFGIQQVSNEVLLSPYKISVTLPDRAVIPCYEGSIPLVISDVPENATISYHNRSDLLNEFLPFYKNTEFGRGEYSIQVMMNGCFQDLNFTVDAPESPLSASIVTKDETCSSSDGFVLIDIKGGKKNDFPYYIKVSRENSSWSDFRIVNDELSLSGIVFNGLSKGRYNILVRSGYLSFTNTSNCEFEESFFIATNNPLVIDSTIITPVNCFGNSDGKVALIVKGDDKANPVWVDTDGYFFDDDGITVSGLSSGVYSFLIKDSRGCVASVESRVNDRTDQVKLNSTPVVTAASCGTAINGAINIQASGGVASKYSYLLSNGNTNSTGQFANLAPNSYTVTVTDGAGCTDVKDIVVPANPNPVSIAVTDFQHQYCSGGDKGWIQVEGKTATGQSLTFSMAPGGQSLVNPTGKVRFGNLTDGLYTITATDNNNCMASASQSITNKNLSPNVSQTVLSPLACSSAQNGRILTTVTDYPGVDGGHNFLFSFKDAQGKEVVASSSSPLQREFGNLSNQTYSLVVTDQYNCSHVNNQVTVPRNPLAVKLADGWVVTPTSCLKARNGTITVSATDGVSLPGGGYHFKLNDGNTTVTQSGVAATFKGLGVGEYQLTVVDAEGCSTTPVTISVPVRSNSLSLSNPMATPTKCFGGDDGSIAISIENDDAPGVTYTYGLMRFEGGAYHETSGYLFNRLDGSFSGLTAGKYCIKVVGDDGCDALFHDIVVGQPTPVLIIDRQYCCIATHGAKNGSFAITAQEGSKEYLYEWIKDGKMVVSSKVGYNNGEGFTFQATGLEPGHYTFRLSDVNQCAYFDQGNSWYETSVEITQPQYPLDMTVTVVQERCHGSNDGAINISASGGWLCSDNHHPGCGNPAHNNCSAWVESPCGIQADYLFSINGGGWQCSPSFDGLTPGTYTVKVKDRAGNEVVREVTLLQRPQLEIVQMDTHPASCPGYANGRVDATIENGVLNGNQQLQYSIINSNTKQLVISLWDGRLFSYGKLPRGDYQLLVTDFNGCIIVKPFSITEPEPMSIAIQHNYIKKKGDATGEIRAMATKGNGQFRYQWFRDQGTNPFAEGGSSGEIALKDLVAGTYTLYVGDTARCDYEQTGEWMKRQVVIEEPEKALRFTEVNKQEVSCFGLSDGQIEIQPEGGWGGYAYVIDQDQQQTSPIFSKLKAGSYKITVTDRENSSWDSTIVIAQPDRLTAELLSTKDIKCFGGNDGSILLDIKGGNLGYQVSVDQAKWQDGHAIHKLTAGVYTMYVKDRLGCRTELKDTQLEQPGKLVLASSAIVESRCSNNEGAISTSHSGGVMPYVFQWKKDTIDNNTVKLIDLPYKTANINALYSSKYSLLVTDAHGCTAGYSFMLGDITDLTIESIAVKDVSCMGYSDGEAKAFVTKGNPDYFYTWDTKIATHQGDLASGLAAGSYSLMVRDVKKCAVTKKFTIGTPDSLLCRVVQKDDPLCEGGAKGSLLVQATGGTPSYHYAWDHGAQGAALNGVEPGNYRLTLTDAHQCKASFTYPFQYRRTLKPSLGNDTTICHYNSLAVDGGNYQRFVWSSDNGFASQQRNVSLTQPGVYCLKVADADNCLGYDTLAVEVSRLSIDRIDVRDVSCHGVGDGEASIALSPASPPCTIVWPDRSSATHWKNLSGGEYPVSVFDAFGCIDTKTFKVVEPSPLAINVDFMRDPLCWGVPDGIIKTVGWGGVGNYQYQWGDGSTKQELSKLDAGRYTLQIKDGNLCTTRETFDLAYSYAINPQLGSDLTLCRGNSAKLWPGEFRTYKWFHNNDRISTDTAVVVGKQGAYHVEVTDSRGCLGRDTLQILMRDTDLNPQFLSASGVAAGDTLIVVEVSQPKPIKIEWAFSGEHKIIESGEYYCKVVFGQPGSYAITLNAYSHNCFGQARRLVLVTPPSETPGNGSENPNGYSNLLSLKVSPNPTDGFFEARVELTDDAPLNIYLVSIASGQIMEQRKGSGMKKYSYDFNIAIPGLYLIVAESKGERRVEKMIVK